VQKTKQLANNLLKDLNKKLVLVQGHDKMIHDETSSLLIRYEQVFKKVKENIFNEDFKLNS
jgi:hypothetical protein